MRESDYYAPGTYYDPHAPWNQSEPDPIERDICTEFTLKNEKPTKTTNFHLVEDEEGRSLEINTNWEEEYTKQHYTPLELINMYKKELEEKKKSLSNQYQIHEIERIISECDGWDEEFNDAYEDK